MNKYKKLIEDYEENHNNIDVAQAVNIRERKDRVIADVKISTENGYERINDCEYPKTLFKGVLE